MQYRDIVFEFPKVYECTDDFWSKHIFLSIFVGNFIQSKTLGATFVPEIENDVLQIYKINNDNSQVEAIYATANVSKDWDNVRAMTFPLRMFDRDFKVWSFIEWKKLYTVSERINNLISGDLSFDESTIFICHVTCTILKTGNLIKVGEFPREHLVTYHNIFEWAFSILSRSISETNWG